MSSTHPIVVASNRGPVAFVRAPDGSVVERRGVGGLVTAVGGALRDRDATWIAAPATDEDRERVDAGQDRADLRWGEGAIHVRFAALDERTHDASYNGFANKVLWFTNHYLWDAVTAPDFEEAHAADWDAFRSVNETFTDLILDEAGEDTLALPQDYHLALVPGMLRARRRSLPVGLFWHTPFCQPDQFGLLPDDWAQTLLSSMLGADLIGFHAQRWADNFAACCREVLGASVRGRSISHAGRRTRIAPYPLGVAADHLAEDAAAPAVKERSAWLAEVVGKRKLVLRADRTELTKNILRGFQAIEHLLAERDDLHGTFVHVAMLSPSREEVPEYVQYLAACHERAASINERYGTPDWTPIVLDVRNDFARTLAGYLRYDVLLVNPVFDGMNLIAREGPLVNERDGVLILSRNAGAAVELGSAALLVNPFDVEGTARALGRALDMSREERAEHAAAVRAVAAGTPPPNWLGAQIKDLARARAR